VIAIVIVTLFDYDCDHDFGNERAMVMNDPPSWQTVATQTAFQNRWVTVAVDQVLLPTGQSYEYTRLKPAGVGVAVLGFNAAGEVLLLREYRHGLGQVIWELPGGLAAGDEDWLAAGLRELAEETGHAPAVVNRETIRYLGTVWDNPALGPMHCHIYAAWGLLPARATHFDAAEFVTQHWVTVEWLKEAVRTGEIKERTTVAAVGYLLLNGWIL
jgi:8-oxo-dGTP pyrophosphatase MutT (NUDIX family)